MSRFRTSWKPKPLYNVLEREIIPIFYDRNNIELPEEWIARMKAAIHKTGEQFSAQRMLMDYTNQFYIPALDAARTLRDDNYKLTKEVTAWMERVTRSWDRIAIRDIDFANSGGTVQVGEKVEVSMKVDLGEISPNDVTVQIVSGQLNSQEQFLDSVPSVAQLNGSPEGDKGIFGYRGEVTCFESGRLGITARVIPHNEHLVHTFKPKLISWW